MTILNKVAFVSVLATLVGGASFGGQEDALFSDKNPFAVPDVPLYRFKDTVHKMWKEDGWTDWFEAVARGNKRLVEVFFKYHKIDINAQGYKKQTALHVAVQNGHVELVKALLQWGANVNAEDKKKETPLHIASREGQVEIVQLLLVEDAIRVNQKNYYDTTPLNVALLNRNIEVARLLLNREDINATQEMLNGWEPLHGAALCGDIEVVKLLLSKEGIDVNTRTHIGWTPLKIAAREGHVEIVKLLLEVKGIKVREGRYFFILLFLVTVKSLWILQ